MAGRNQGNDRVVILSIESLSGANSTENNVMKQAGVVDGVVFNQDELVSSNIAVKKYGAYIMHPNDIKEVPTIEYAGETYVFGVYTLSASAATTYRKGTVFEFKQFLGGEFPDNGMFAFINTKNITG